ncbi:DUF2079 domain-containing protein [Leptospira sp. 96542]|nr:DUF2079 domain-containing protein [Leptospira sp. 96542]
MIYLFFALSLTTPILLLIPKTFHRPLNQGAIILLILTLVLTYIPKIENKIKLEFKNIEIFLIISTLVFIISTFFHAVQITSEFANQLLFQDADYIGISDIFLSIWDGRGFTSSYYSEDGESSFLKHHFSPGLVFASPIVSLFPNRLGLTFLSFFCYQLTVIFWLLWAYSIFKKDKEKYSTKFILFWICILNQPYLYRIGVSYHFETLIPIFSILFFISFEFSRTQTKKNQKNFHLLMLVCFGFFLSVKEDLTIYAALFFVPVFFYEFRKTKKIEIIWYWVFGTIICWFLLAFVLYPFFTNDGKTLFWQTELTKDYGPNYKLNKGFYSQTKVFIEFMISMGIGVLYFIPYTIGIFFVYLTHVFSNRPWHHEIYSYYSYSMIPYLLYSSILWIKSNVSIGLRFLLISLLLIFYKNSLDSNFPIQLKQNEQIPLELSTKLQNEILLWQTNSELPKIAYTQYNLGFFISKSIRIKPINLYHDQCKKANECYIIVAPEATNEAIWPKTKFYSLEEDIKTNFNGKLIWEGELLHIWKVKKYFGIL